MGTSIGTPAYMALEQAVGDVNTDARADLYAWGVVAYELLAGAHPFAHCTTPQALVAAHIAETPRALSDVKPTIPRDVSALVMECLAKDPLQRPVNAHAVLERLSTIATPPRQSDPPQLDATAAAQGRRPRSRRADRRRWVVGHARSRTGIVGRHE